MALQTVLLVAAYFGEEEIAWVDSNQKTVGLIVSILLIQIVAIFGAILTARASERFGNIRVLIAINIIWIILCILAYNVKTRSTKSNGADKKELLRELQRYTTFEHSFTHSLTHSPTC